MPEETAPVTPTEPTPAEAAAAEEQHQTWLETLDPKTAGEIRRLRDESANYRTKLREAEAPLQTYSPEERQIWSRLMTTFAQDPEAGAKAMQEIVNGVLTPAQAVAEAEAGGEGAVVTQTQLEQALRQRDEQYATQGEVQKLQTEARALGYEPGTKGYYDLLYMAQSTPNFDLSKAHELVQGERQKVIDEYVESLKNDAGGNLAPSSGGAPANDKEILTFEEARRSLEQRLKQA